MVLPSVLRLLVLSTLALNWYGASGAAVVIGRAAEEVNPHRRRECKNPGLFIFGPDEGSQGEEIYVLEKEITNMKGFWGWGKYS